MSVNLGSTFKQLIDEINSKSDGNIDLSGKTNTSVLPNDSGDIKTKFRIAQKGYTDTSTWYYPIFKFPANNNGNYASAIVTGRIGGWESDNMSYINALLWNRGTPAISLIDIAGTASNMNSIWNIADLVLYVDTDATATIYIKCNGYFTFDIDLELFQSTASIVYDGSHLTTTPSGTLTAQASTSTKRLELVNGKLLANGQELQVKLTAGNNITISGTTISATQPTVDSTLSDSSTNAVQNKVVKEALDGKQASGNYVKYTAHSNVTAGKKTNVTTYTYEQSPMVVSSGMIIGGTAQDAGLVTRGISGASTPDTSTGACSTDHLYVNFDGDRKYSRYMILGAGETGDDITTNSTKTSYAAKQYGTLMSAVRGDQMVNYVSDKLANVPTADDLSEIKAAVAGKAQSYILSLNDKFSTGSTGAKWYDKDGNDITSSIKTGNYVDANCKNSSFNNSTNPVVISPSDTAYFIFRLSNSNTASLGSYDYLVCSTKQVNTTFNVGDNFYIIETGVPDRWFGGNSNYYPLEGKPLSDYVVKTGNNTLSGNNIYTGTNQHKGTEYFYKGVIASNDSNLSDIATYKYNGITAGEYNLTFPSKSGTLAVTSDIDIKAANDNVFTGTQNTFKRVITASGTEITYKVVVDPMQGIYTYPANSNIYTAYTNSGIVVKNATGAITYQLPSGSGTDYKTIATTSHLNNYVNLTGKQTISGAKTFTGDVTVDGGTFKVSKTDSSSKTMSAVYGPNAITYTPYGSTSQKLISLPSSDGTIALTSDIPSTTNLVTTNTDQTITAVKTFNAPANISGTQQVTTKFMTSNGGSISIGKEGPNSGTMLAFKQDDSKDANRLLFRASATAGAMVWEQPEAGATLYFDLGNATGSGKNRITLRSKAGNIALTNELPAAVLANPTLAGTESELTSIKIGSTSYKLPSGGEVSQPDYNQNDESASDYIKNRPFYKEGSEETTTYFDKTIDLAVLDEDDPNIFIYSESTPISLTAGDEVSVLFDGNTYSQTVLAYAGQALYIGNLAILESSLTNTGEPFLIVGNLNAATSGEGSSIIATEQKTNCHVKIYKTVYTGTIHYMDSTYIKDMYYEEDGKIHKVDNKYLDIVDSSDVKTILSKTTITLSTEDGKSAGTYSENIFLDKADEFLGKYFIVIIDNKEYKSECREVSETPYFGNLALLNDELASYNTGEDFLVLPGGDTTNIVVSYVASSLTLEIKEFEHISYKYLKDAYYTKHIHRTDLSLSFSTSVDDSNRNTYSRTDYDNDYGISSDKKYVVVYNGTEYAQEVKTGNVTYNDVQTSIRYLGNLSLYDSTKTNTDEPFFVTINSNIVPEWFGVLVVTSEAQTNATLDIIEDYDIIYYLDDKYINAANRLKTWIKDAQETSSFSIPTPSKNTDLVDKQYVDGLKVTSIDGLAGGILTSPLTIDSTVGLNCKFGTDSSTSFPLIQYDGQEITIGTVASQPLKIIGATGSTIGGIEFTDLARISGDNKFTGSNTFSGKTLFTSVTEVTSQALHAIKGVYGSEYNLDSNGLKVGLGSTTDPATYYKVGKITNMDVDLTLPTTAGTLATQEYVATLIGNIDTLLTALNSGTGV